MSDEGSLQAGSEMAVWEDLRELRDETEGVRLWLKRSRGSFSWDSESESWDWGSKASSEVNAHLYRLKNGTNVEQKHSHLVSCDLRGRIFDSKLSALFCSYFSVAVKQRCGIKSSQEYSNPLNLFTCHITTTIVSVFHLAFM